MTTHTHEEKRKEAQISSHAVAFDGEMDYSAEKRKRGLVGRPDVLLPIPRETCKGPRNENEKEKENTLRKKGEKKDDASTFFQFLFISFSPFRKNDRKTSAGHLFFQMWWACLLVLLHATTESESSDLRESKLVAQVPGDVVLGGLFPMHEHNISRRDQPCGAIKEEKGIQVGI